MQEVFRYRHTGCRTVCNQNTFSFPAGTDEDMIMFGCRDGQGAGDSVDLHIRIEAILSDKVDNIIEFKIFFLDILPHPAGIFTTGRSDGKLALQGVIIKKGEKSTVKLQSLL